jgi:predicted permease
VGGTLVVVQTALATTIVITTLFLTDTFVGLHRADLGMQTPGLLTGRVSLSSKYASGSAAAPFFDRLIDVAEDTPGIRQAAAITQLPLSGAMLGSTFLADDSGDVRRIDADLRGVTPHYFEVVGTPLLRGRDFDVRDAPDAPPVAIIDEGFARRLRGDGNALGLRIRWIRQPAVELQIVGIVQSVRHRGPSEAPRETVYRPHRQYPRQSMFIVLKTEGDAVSAAPVLRKIVASVDASQPLSDIATMEDRLDHALSAPRTSLMLAGVLTVIALTLGGIGVYGVLSFGVAQRVREFGVRSALGARPAELRRLVWREGLTLTLRGASIGVLGAALLSRAAGATVFVASGIHLRPYALGLALVLVSCTLAFWLPARRAGGADPSTVLRAD